MDKREMALLERAYSAEVSAALGKSGMNLMQTKSKLAEKLVEEGFLRKRSIRMHGPWPCTVDGYELTEAGRLAYCLGVVHSARAEPQRGSNPRALHPHTKQAPNA